MRKITFHKAEFLCIYCHKNRVFKWNTRCEECKKNRNIRETKGSVVIGSRIPAAIIKTDNGDEVYVDKFGKEVSNPGYNLKDDPTGKKFTGKIKRSRTMI